MGLFQKKTDSWETLEQTWQGSNFWSTSASDVLAFVYNDIYQSSDWVKLFFSLFFMLAMIAKFRHRTVVFKVNPVLCHLSRDDFWASFFLKRLKFTNLLPFCPTWKWCNQKETNERFPASVLRMGTIIFRVRRNCVFLTRALVKLRFLVAR